MKIKKIASASLALALVLPIISNSENKINYYSPIIASASEENQNNIIVTENQVIETDPLFTSKNSNVTFESEYVNGLMVDSTGRLVGKPLGIDFGNSTSKIISIPVYRKDNSIKKSFNGNVKTLSLQHDSGTKIFSVGTEYDNLKTLYVNESLTMTTHLKTFSNPIELFKDYVILKADPELRAELIATKDSINIPKKSSETGYDISRLSKDWKDGIKNALNARKDPDKNYNILTDSVYLESFIYEYVSLLGGEVTKIESKSEDWGADNTYKNSSYDFSYEYSPKTLAGNVNIKVMKDTDGDGIPDEIDENVNNPDPLTAEALEVGSLKENEEINSSIKAVKVNKPNAIIESQVVAGLKINQKGELEGLPKINNWEDEEESREITIPVTVKSGDEEESISVKVTIIKGVPEITEIELIASMVKDLNEQLKESKEEKTSLQAKIDDLTGKLAEEKANNTLTQGQLENKNQELEKANNELEKLREKLEESQSKIEESNKQLAILEGQSVVDKAEIEKLKAELEKLKAENTSQSNEANEMQNEIAEMKNKIQNLEEENKKLKDDNQEKTEIIEDLNQTIIEKDKELDDNKAKLEELNKKVKDLNEQLENGNKDEVDKQLEEAKKEVEDLKKKNEELVNSLEKEKQKANEALSDNEKDKAKLEEVSNALNKYQKEAEELKDKIAKLEENLNKGSSDDNKKSDVTSKENNEKIQGIKVEDKKNKVQLTIPKLNNINDIHKPTTAEKEAIKKAILEANKNVLPEGTNIEVLDNGDVKITYPNGATTKITADELEKALNKDVSNLSNNKVEPEELGKGGKLPKTGEQILGYVLSAGAIVAGAFGLKKKNKK